VVKKEEKEKKGKKIKRKERKELVSQILFRLALETGDDLKVD